MTAEPAGRRAVALTRDLVRVPSRNPADVDGAEAEERVAALLAPPLERAGFSVAAHAFAPGRTSLLATLPGREGSAPLGLAGHIDTVPLGLAPWSVDPFAADITDGRLYGRGASDMKSGIAAMVTAAAEAARTGQVGGGLVIMICAGEETGCEGAAHLSQAADLPALGGLVVPEPTGNDMVLAHKGALWLELEAGGHTAHGSMPHLGDNALTKLLAALSRLDGMDMAVDSHPLLGPVTRNLSQVHGGENVNSVPDRARATVDVRTVPGVAHQRLLSRVRDVVGPDVSVEAITDLPPVGTGLDDEWVTAVRERVERVTGRPQPGTGITYFTDASVLTPATGGPPTVILGPGPAEQAHRTDEYCLVDDIEQSVEILREIITAGSVGPRADTPSRMPHWGMR